MESIIQQIKKCYVCGTTVSLESHHCIHGTANRAKAEQYGLKVWLCNKHHTGSSESVHRNNDMDLFFKQLAQEYFEEICGSREDFIKEFGKSYR